MNNQIESLINENNKLKNELKEKESENKNLKKDLKEKEERIAAFEREKKLKELEEKRLNQGKIKESGFLNDENNDNNHLKLSEFGAVSENEINEIGKSQEELIKENEKLKDEIMILKKDLEVLRATQKSATSNNEKIEDKKDNNSGNKEGDDLLKESYLSLGQNYQEN